MSEVAQTNDDSQLLNQALEYHRAGELDAARRMYGQLLSRNPEQADALHFLGLLECQLRRHDVGVPLLERSLGKQSNATYCNNFGNVLLDLGRLDEAIDSYRRAIGLKADYAEAHNNLGNALRQARQFDAAFRACAEAIRLQPRYVEAFNNLGNALHEMGELDDAVASYCKAIELKPDYALAYSNLASILREQDKKDLAIECYRKALDLQPDLWSAHRNLCLLLREKREWEGMLEACRKVIAVDPRNASAYRELGVGYFFLGQREAAMLSFRHALDIDPTDDVTWHGLAIVLRDDDQLDEALDAVHKALSFGEKTGAKYLTLGDIMNARGATDEALDVILKALELGSEPVQSYNRLLFAMPGSPRYSPAQVYEHAVRFGKIAVAGVKPFEHVRSRNVERPLRVGFVSGDFGQHPVGIFLESILGHLDRTRIEPIAYVTFHKNDQITERLKPNFSAWYSIEQMPTEAAARKIYEDEIDILVDLSGHTAYTGLPIFAWKPAPLQVSWLGFFATTGCAFIDYFIGDPYTLPESEEQYFVEKPWRLPDSYLCFTPPEGAPDVGPLPARQNGFVTFGYFGKLGKVKDDVVRVWSELLHRVPDSKLFLKAIGLWADYSRHETIKRFAEHGISADRLVLEGESARAVYLEAYNRVDVILSPFPYPGGTTTAEALWMGAPVLCLKGDRFLSHICESLVHSAGLGDWVAESEEDYLGKAIGYGADLERLMALRAGMREQVRVSPMCDAPRFARNLVDAFHQMWSKHLAAL